ncbi:MAG: carboxypeptidase [Oscillospiraceae bacterium]|nr:carboxypeptidase [Oscillospiraceae bacterium]
MEGCVNAKTVTVVRTVTVVGDGSKDDPVREVVQYWTTDGKLIGEEPN